MTLRPELTVAFALALHELATNAAKYGALSNDIGTVTLAWSVDGDGELRRCHFIPTRLGNLYADPLEQVVQERRCSRLRCDCFIGYAQRRDLPLHEQFGNGLLARIPIASA